MKKYLYIISLFLLLGCGRDNIKSDHTTINDNTKPEISTDASAKSGTTNVIGKKIWDKCIGCHGRNGEKKALGKSDPIGGQDRAITISQLRDYRSGNLEQYGMGGLMKGQVAQLSDVDIELVSIYIESLSGN